MKASKERKLKLRRNNQPRAFAKAKAKANKAHFGVGHQQQQASGGMAYAGGFLFRGILSSGNFSRYVFFTLLEHRRTRTRLTTKR